MAAIFLPGITVPAHIAYAPLLGELAGSTTSFTKELEVYRDEQPPDGYRLDLEIEGLERFAVDQGETEDPTLFPRCAVLRYEDRHHLDAPHQAEPTRVAATLRELWAAPAP
jgi:hypothetical protein